MRNLKKNWFKCMMFLSSYFPLYIMLLILNFQKCMQLLNSKNIKVIFFMVAIGICIIISLVSILLLKMSPVTKKIKIIEIERPDDTIISYMMTYIIPILTTNLVDDQAVIVNIILFLLIGYLYVRLNLLYLNPLWSMFGFLAFRANSDIIVVTDIKYSEFKQMKGGTLSGFFLANDIFIARNSDNQTI